jgi:sugar phosphate isomerase/epimerase
MKIGYAAPLSYAPKLADMGYDYIEAPLFAYDVLTSAGLSEAKRSVTSSPLPPLVMNNFFPTDMRIVGPNVDEAHLKRYLAGVAEVCHFARARAAVLGAAWARNVPDGWERTTAHEQLVEAFGWAADAFAGTGTTVAIEPQNYQEANIIRLVPEAVAFVKEVGRDEVRAMVDFYHVYEEQEPLDDVSRNGEWIVHVQTADTGRRHPGSGSYDYPAIAAQLALAGYDETITVEVMIELTDQQMMDSLRFLRSIWPT